MADIYDLVLVNPGVDFEYRGMHGVRRNVRIDRVWEVRKGDKVIGVVRYALVTRERRTPGRRYVNARWQSPGWLYVDGPARHGRTWDAYSRKDAVERIIRNHESE